MRIYLEAFDAAGNRLGDGPVVTLISAQVTRMLDGVGTIQFETPATDERALDILVPRTHFRLYCDHLGIVREVGRGVVLKRELRETDAGARFVYECADALTALKNYAVHIGRTYSQQTIATMVADLIGLVPDWSADVQPDVAALAVDARFDGVSVLDALVELCRNNGIHFRLAAAGNVVEVGGFGADSGVLALNAETSSAELHQRENVALVQTLNAGDDSEALTNWLVPLGAGEDAAALTLENSTRSAPYPIQTGTGPDGRTYWYLADADSIAAYGRAEQYITFKNIAAISNTDADKIAAADALYDAAAAYLRNMKQPRRSYTLGVVGLKQTLHAGDKVNVRYRGRVLKEGRAVDYAHLDEAMYLLRVTEKFGVEAGGAALTVSNADTADDSVEEVLVRGLNEIAMRGLRPAVGMSCRTYVYPREIAPSHPCIVPVEITNATLDVVRVRVRLKTMPLRATSVQGPHRHGMFQLGGAISSPGPENNRVVLAYDDENGTITTACAMRYTGTGNMGDYLWTWTAGGGVIYGVKDDTVTPRSLSLWIDGIDRTADFGGPWAASGGSRNILLDVGLLTGFITNAAGGMYGEHTLEFRCGSGHGRCEVTVEIYEVLQGIDPR